jgi:hypothetical protein
MIANKIMLLGLILASGCAIDPPQSRVRQTTTLPARPDATPKDALNKPGDISDDLKAQVNDGKVSLSEARTIENERRAAQARQVQNSLDQIRKEAREEYAASRPAKIKNALLKEQLCLGMDDKDILVCLGQPERKNRVITHSGMRENWLYKKLSVWFDDGVVSGWQQEE